MEELRKEILRIAMAQINCTVGDLEGNRKKINEHIQKAEVCGADIVAFPELALTGYPPEDLLLKPEFIEDNLEALNELAVSVDNIVVIAGFVDKKGDNIYNAAAVIYAGKVVGVYHKMLLPNYGVFDEKRYFKAGNSPLVFRYGRCVFGVNICEDIWHREGPARLQASLGAKVIFNINASPYHAGKAKEREKTIQEQARVNRLHIVYINLVGGQDELVFDGRSMAVDNKGGLIKKAEAFKEDLVFLDLSIPTGRNSPSKRVILIEEEMPYKNRIFLSPKKARPLGRLAEIYQALVLGLKDYVYKNGFGSVVIGLSGGIDSSLVAALAVDAIGKDNVTGIFMPSRYSSSESEADARGLAQNLGVKFVNVSIEQIYKMYLMLLEPHFLGLERNIAEENLQARIRGNILMAFSNKFNWLVLTTGNKSEMSTGYATLYGDMAGGFAVIKDVSKTSVYELARYRNSLNAIIPERVFIKAPTAELRPNQKDSDTLPLYEDLDPILKAYIEEDRDLDGIVSLGFSREAASKVLHMVDKSEYKRRQSPPGIKVTPKAFGKDRRMPITNKYRG